MANAVTSLNFTSEREGHKELIELVNKYAALPKHRNFETSALIKDLLVRALEKELNIPADTNSSSEGNDTTK